ncbi:MAG: ABC transporter permease subunit, partial [Caldilineae bacterium]
MARLLDWEAKERHAPPGVPARPAPLNRRSVGVILAGAVILWALAQAGLFGGEVVNPGGWPLVLRFLRAGLHPERNPAFLRLVFRAALVTLAYAVSGATLSTLFGFVGGVLASEVWWRAVMPSRGGGRRWSGYRTPWLVVRGGLALPRAIHEIIWGLFFVNILGLTPLTAILAIAIPFGAITAKVFSEILDETPRRPLDALLNSGVSPLQALVYGLLPQAFPNLLSYAFYRLECSIRAAAVLGIIGAGGLGYEIFLSLQSLRYEQMWTLFFALFLLSGLTDFWSGLLRRRMGVANRLALNLPAGKRRKIAPPRRDAVVSISLVAAAGLVTFSFWYLRPDFTQLLAPRTTRLLAGVIRDSFPPDFGNGGTGELFALSAQTLAMSILAMSGAGLLGILLSFPAARNVSLPDGGGGWVRRASGMGMLLAVRTLLLVARAIPAPIWALILMFVLFPG